MNFGDVVRHVSNGLPDFNDWALRGFVEESINNSPDFPAMVFKEGFKLLDKDVGYVDYKILSPEETVKFELKSGPGKQTRSKIPLTVSHLQLVEYRIRVGEQFSYCKLYTPYMFDDMLFINGKRSMPRKTILEQTCSRVQEKDKDGISVSPVRVNLVFNRRKAFRIESYVTGQPYTHFIVTANMFHGKINTKICDRTILHYMLAKFGFAQTLHKFGLRMEDIYFTDVIGDDVDVFEYFAAKPTVNPEAGPGLYLKANKTLLMDDQTLKFVVNLMYVVNFFDIQTFENVYAEEGSIWKIILGILAFEERSPLKAHSNAESHIRSVDHFIDPLTRRRFHTFGLHVNDIYELLVYIFTNIDFLMVGRQAQDIYHSRIDVLNGIFVELFARRMNTSLYQLTKRTNITQSDVDSAIKFSPTMFTRATGAKKDDSEHYIAPPEIINDNYLFAGGLNKIRLGGKAEQRFHPSMMVVESINAFVGKQIGKTGYLNPHVPMDRNGAILHPDYCGQIDSISRYVPK